jgi:hypothetical protein
MLMTPPPALGGSPLFSPAAVNRQQIQQQSIPGLQSAQLLNRGTTGLNTGMSPLSSNAGKTTGTGNTAMMANLLGRG